MLSPSATLNPLTAAAPNAHVAVATPLARAILAHGLLLGIAADALLRDGLPGLAIPLWIGLAAVVLVSLTRRARETPGIEESGWLLTAMLFACLIAWRDSGILQAFDMLAAVGALAMAAITIRHRSDALFAQQFRQTVWAALALVRRIAAGITGRTCQHRPRQARAQARHQ